MSGRPGAGATLAGVALPRRTTAAQPPPTGATAADAMEGEASGIARAGSDERVVGALDVVEGEADGARCIEADEGVSAVEAICATGGAISAAAKELLSSCLTSSRFAGCKEGPSDF